ncbi:hypothetical protein A7K94_0216625, partial [Modestobacter sp. VKM Ac-2676]
MSLWPHRSHPRPDGGRDPAARGRGARHGRAVRRGGGRRRRCRPERGTGAGPGPPVGAGGGRRG